MPEKVNTETKTETEIKFNQSTKYYNYCQDKFTKPGKPRIICYCYQDLQSELQQFLGSLIMKKYVITLYKKNLWLLVTSSKQN